MPGKANRSSRGKRAGKLFKTTKAIIMAATVGQQVSLIKSIPSQYFTDVEGLVMRSVQTGRDLGQLTKDLQEQFGVTCRRAAFIARDQNNKATASMTRARQDELGITQAIWVHSGAGKHPRPTHVAMNGTKYDVNRAWGTRR
ncbi:MAG: phage head morphosis protein [Bradyrhizobium sp.]|nr:phage head morphosis protein [Bradyrhizobium sp.]